MATSRRLSFADIRGMHILMCMLAFALLLRAAIPIGFMPDAEALRQGKIEITFCTVGGGLTTTVIDIDNDTHQPDTSSSDHTNAACASSALSPVALDLPSYVVQPVAMHTSLSLRLAHDSAVLPLLPAIGPPLGARAPPHLG